jgi:hypothetical protein
MRSKGTTSTAMRVETACPSESFSASTTLLKHRKSSFENYPLLLSAIQSVRKLSKAK